MLESWSTGPLEVYRSTGPLEVYRFYSPAIYLKTVFVESRFYIERLYAGILEHWSFGSVSKHWTFGSVSELVLGAWSVGSCHNQYGPSLLIFYSWGPVLELCVFPPLAVLVFFVVILSFLC